jgi:16S rRNA (cytosine967-C5)-methyltransferase
MKKSIRHLASDILDQVQKNKAFAGFLLDEYLDAFEISGTPDGRLLTHLVYGVLRQRGHLDWILAKLCRRNWEKMDESVKNILRSGLFQLKFSSRLPAFAVIDEAVKVTKNVNFAKSGLVNAVLRNFLRHGDEITFPSPDKNPAEYISAFHSHPLWLVRNWIKSFGIKETEALCAADNELPPLTLRTNTLKITRDDLKEKLSTAGSDVKCTSFSPDGLVLDNNEAPLRKTKFFQDGYMRIQDEGSQLISYVVNPKSAESVLDVCSGAGGKTTHLAAILKNHGIISAIDNDFNKIEELKNDAKRLGITIIGTYQADMTGVLPNFLKDKFAHVLVDAPCTGLGTLRRNPEIKWHISAADFFDLNKTQQKILHNASSAVKSGGHLIYSTCSFAPQENEHIVSNFLKEHSDFSISPLPGIISSQFIDDQGYFRTFPHLHNMDGFFVAVLKRKSFF